MFRGTPLAVLTEIHVGIVTALFWSLFANGNIATQAVEDGSGSGIIPFTAIAVAFFAATTRIALVTRMPFTHVFGRTSSLGELKSIPVFMLTSIWPAACRHGNLLNALAYIVLGVLKEVRPMWFYVLGRMLFVLSQLDCFLPNKVICTGDDMGDGGFGRAVPRIADYH
ncbi:hypothetical protein FIBSPDRAFT_993417 [Athelia psychrophila]|uniref:Uncharacterized protein n=1 Tax=Athelia psychrophila TaxID=1759441 RepID=A0A165YBT7_9AGAM|nr:hypothetical protein FIBSPDRAFT_993417 [Fibularhizoctonia sp. CBS 109695]